MKTDLRILKSKKSIEDAFINLVEIKGFQKITIKEIADKAVVNRNTIYLNYGSKEGILESIVKSSLEKYFGTLKIEDFSKTKLTKKNIENIYRNLFYVVDENIELFRILITDHSSTGYLQTEFLKIRKFVDKKIKPNDENKTKLAFLGNGILGALRTYIVLAIGTAEENIKILTDLTITNIRKMSFLK